MIFFIPFVVLVSFYSSYSFSKESFYGQREKGWFWYKENKKLQDKKNKSTKPKVLTPREYLKRQGKDWENALSTAILDPNRKNILKYIDQTQKIHEQSRRFSKKFQDVIWTNPQYDQSLKNPNNTEAIVAQNEKRVIEENLILSDISENFGLIFMFDPKCPVCHKFAPILKKFEDHYNLNVLGVSSTGKGIAQYPYPKSDYSFGSKVNTKVYPSLFLVDVNRGKITPVSYGYVGWSTLMKKMISAYKRINDD